MGNQDSKEKSDWPQVGLILKPPTADGRCPLGVGGVHTFLPPTLKVHLHPEGQPLRQVLTDSPQTQGELSSQHWNQDLFQTCSA